jgi:8-oxo-(d)GTP phosphatase
MDKAPEIGPIRAAGGIVCGIGVNHGKIAVVRRRRYTNEVALPKGKLNAGESELDAALREVGEETGITATIRKHSGTTRYQVNGRPKTVVYFLMDASEAGAGHPSDKDEIEAVEWVTPNQAIAVLTHEEDRTLIANVFAQIGK